MDAAAQGHAAGLAAGAACFEAALAYRARGWSVLCLCPPDHVGVGKAHAQGCGHPGKRPLANGGAWKEYQGRLPAEEELREWWRRHPNANVGAALGPVSRLVRVDVEGAAAEARLLEVSGGDRPPTCAFRSGRRDGTGRGLLYALPDGVEARTSVQGLEAGGELRVQGCGAQTVLPPSRHVDGGVYAWEPGCSPAEIDPAPAPGWLLALLAAPPRGTPTLGVGDGEMIRAGICDTVLTRWAGGMRHDSFSEAAIRAALQVEIEAGRCEKAEGKRAYDATDAARIARSVASYEPDAYATTALVRAPNGVHEANGKNVAGSGAAPRIRLATRTLDTVRPRPVRWLVPGILPLGKLVLVAGDGGHGKSVLTLSLAASVSSGRPCLGLVYNAPEPADVMIACCEDDYADTVVPRLMCHRADRSRIHAIDGVKGADGKVQPFSLADFNALAAELEQRRTVRLVIVDPAGAFIGRTGVDDHKDSELRALLGPLSELAAEHNVTILLVKHLNKGATAKAVHKVGGSAGYVNAVRAAFVLTPDPVTPEVKLFLPLKFNLGPKPRGLCCKTGSLSLEEEEAVLDSVGGLNDEDRAALRQQLFRLEWHGTVETDADEAMAPKQAQQKTDRVEECAEWLQSFLAVHAYPSDEVIAAAKKAGYGRDLCFRAKREIPDLRASKAGFNLGWWWGLGDPAEWKRRPAPDASDGSDASVPSDASGRFGGRKRHDVDNPTVPFQPRSVPKRPEDTEGTEASEASEQSSGSSRSLVPADPRRHCVVAALGIAGPSGLEAAAANANLPVADVEAVLSALVKDGEVLASLGGSGVVYSLP